LTWGTSSVLSSDDCASPLAAPHSIYSPDFNPIENAFAKLKALLRKAAERTVEGLWTAIGRLIEVFTPIECANYFQAAGYDAT
jgi:transposase